MSAWLLGFDGVRGLAGWSGSSFSKASADSVDAFVAARKRDGSDYLKIALNGLRTATAGASNLDEASVVALVRAGHARSMLVVAHAETVADARIAVNSGVDNLMHVWREAGPAADVVAQIVRRGTFVVPTIAVFDGFVSGSGAALVADTRLAPFVPAAVKDRLLRPPTPTLPVDVESKLAAVRALQMAGAKLVAGTDGGSVTPPFTVSVCIENSSCSSWEDCARRKR